METNSTLIYNENAELINSAIPSSPVTCYGHGFTYSKYANTIYSCGGYTSGAITGKYLHLSINKRRILIKGKITYIQEHATCQI